MGLLFFELKKEHLLLLKHLRWSLLDGKMLVSVEDFHDDPVLLGTNDVYEGIDIILNGRPSKFDPLNTFDPIEYTPEQKAEWDKLLAELPIAIEVILYRQDFTLGKYKSIFHERDWKLTPTGF